MPIQTGVIDRMIPDGCQILIDYPIGTGFQDAGEILGDTTAELKYSEFQGEITNAGQPDPIVKDMTLEGKFTLLNMDLAIWEKLGSGIFTKEVISSAPTTNIANQLIAANWIDNTPIPMILSDITSGVNYRASVTPTIVSVTGSIAGPLTLNVDYFIIADITSLSGFSIIPTTTGLAGLVTTETITIDYNSVTPVASVKLSAGTTRKILAPFAMQLKHTDSAGKIMLAEFFRVYMAAGTFNFGFLSPNADGFVSQPIAFKALIDPSKTDNKQLFTVTREEGAI